MRVVVDGQSRLASHYQCFNDGFPTYVASTLHHADTKQGHYLKVNAKNNKVDLNHLMLQLGAMQFNEVWVEAGPGLSGALFEAGEVDEFICYQAPMLLGDQARSMVSLPQFTAIDQAVSLTLTGVPSRW